jgi:hypothetical protein
MLPRSNRLYYGGWFASKHRQLRYTHKPCL